MMMIDQCDSFIKKIKMIRQMIMIDKYGSAYTPRISFSNPSLPLHPPSWQLIHPAPETPKLLKMIQRYWDCRPGTEDEWNRVGLELQTWTPCKGGKYNPERLGRWQQRKEKSKERENVDQSGPEERSWGKLAKGIGPGDRLRQEECGPGQGGRRSEMEG